MQTEFRLERGGMLLLDQNQSVAAPSGTRASVLYLVTLNNHLADRTVSYRRRIFQMSALSTVDGRLCAYHGCNG